MASNLNKAFLRAYAKERAASPPEPKLPEPQPPEPRLPEPKLVQSSAGLHSPVAENAPSQASRGASQVWQRIDVAHEQRGPHFGAQSARPATAAAAVGQTRAPRSLQVAAQAAANPKVAGVASSGSPVHPWIAESVEIYGAAITAPEAMSDGTKVDARRRTVADFLYAAGQVTSSVKPLSSDLAAGLHSTGHAASGHPVSGHQPRSLPLGNFTAPLPPLATAHENQSIRSAAPSPSSGYSRGSMSSNYFQHPQASGANHATPAVAAPSLPLPSYPGPGYPSPRKSAVEPSSGFQPYGLQQGHAESTPLNVAEGSVSRGNTAIPLTIGSTGESAQIELGSRSSGQILRVDVPRVRQRPEQEPSQPASEVPEMDVAAPLEPQAVAVDAEAAAAAELADQRRRLDREQAIHIAEKNLRRAAHQIFNPVWEVDSLQWSSVCETLMLERADSMTQVAEHLKMACQDGLNVLAVTSAQRGEGRTTVACCLARLAAAHGLKVALVDIDLETTTLCLQTNLEVEHDWCDWLSGHASLEEAAVYSLADQLTLFPLKPGEDLIEVAQRQSQIVDMLAQLADRFELVIIDTSSLSSAGNVVRALAQGGLVDAAIIVADRRQTTAPRIERAVSTVQAAGIESIGIVENFST